MALVSGPTAQAPPQNTESPDGVWAQGTERIDAISVALRSEDFAKLKWLYLMVGLEFTGFAILIPVMPFFLIKELGFTPQMIGYVLAANSAANLIGSLVFGRLSDSYGRKPLIIFGWSWVFLGCTAMSLVQTFEHVIVVRSMQGLSGGTMILCHSYMLDVLELEKQPRFFGLFGGITACSFMAGPAIAALLIYVEMNRRYIFLVAGGAALIGTIIGAIFLEESLPVEKRRPLCGAREESSLTDGAPAGEIVNKGLCMVWTVRFLFSMAQGFLYGTYAFLIGDMFGWSDMHFGLILFAGGFLGGFMQVVIYPSLARAIGVPMTLLGGCMAGAAAYVLYPQGIIFVHILGIICFALCNSFVEPSIPVVVGKFAGERHLGFGNGVAGASRGAAIVIAPLIASALYATDPAMTYYVGAAIFTGGAACAFGVILLYEDEPSEKEPLLKKNAESA